MKEVSFKPIKTSGPVSDNPLDEWILEYPHGRFTINVKNFFAKAGLPDIRKFLKLAKDYGYENDRERLLGQLENAKQYWDGNCTSYHQWAPRTKKQVEALQVKLQKVINLVADSVWTGEKMDYWNAWGKYDS